MKNPRKPFGYKFANENSKIHTEFLVFSLGVAAEFIAYMRLKFMQLFYVLMCY